MKKIILSIIIFVEVIFGQTVSISGTVTDKSGQPLQGAIVTLLSARLTDTSDANGAYTLTNAATPIRGTNAKQQAANVLRYQGNKFAFTTATPSFFSVKLFDCRGVLIATVYEGIAKQGITVVPFSFEKLGRKAFVMSVRTGDKRSNYKFVPLEGCDFTVSGECPMADQALLRKTAAADWLQATKAGYASHVEQLSSSSATIDIVLDRYTAPDFGANVLMFDPTMSTTAMQTQLNTIYKQQEPNEFGTNRYAYLFKPGKYNLDVGVGYYVQVLGLGLSPDSVEITGAVRCMDGTTWGNACVNFWRGVENLSVVPTQSGNANVWAVAQSTPLRRLHIKGNLKLWDKSWASGGFLADSKIDGTVDPGVQQQWLSRNCEWGTWGPNTGSWNLVFVGDVNPPSGTWPSQPYIRP